MRTVVEQIKDRLPITEILGSYITLVPSGNQFKGRCPFHNEKTPSFNVSPSQGLYYCFGCGAKGDIFTFVEQFEGTDFSGALKILADKAGVNLKEDSRQRNDTDPLYDIMEKAASLYEENLQKNNVSLAYLKNRGVNEESIKNFRLGYAPTEWQYIANTLKKETIPPAITSGLVKEIDRDGKTRLYDRFRGRIMFPMSDSSGRVIAFSGRIFPENPDGGPKYLNSPETPIFHKSKILYGFDKAKFAIKKNNFAILVEGQMDMVMSHQVGFKNTVATSGTAVSDEAITDPSAHLYVISKLTSNLFMAFDGDAAGHKALQRAALVALKLGMNPKVVPLPEGRDPADFIKEFGAGGWKELLKDSPHYIFYQLEKIKKESSPHIFSKELRLHIFPYLLAIPSSVERNSFINAISEQTGISTSNLIEDLEKLSLEQVTKVEQVQENTAQVKELFPTYLRLYTFAHLYNDPDINTELKSIDSLSFKENNYTAPQYSDLEIDAAKMFIEKEYSHLALEEKIKLAKDFRERLEQDFYSEIYTKYSSQLKQIEKEGGDDEELITILRELSLKKHKI